jgi:hypothetical protein
MISRRAGRRIGYVVAIVVNLLIYGFINAWPGWESFDFITPAAADVVPMVNLSVTVAILVNIVYLFADGTRVKAFARSWRQQRRRSPPPSSSTRSRSTSARTHSRGRSWCASFW